MFNDGFLLSEARRKITEAERLAARAAALHALKRTQPGVRVRLARTLVALAARLSPEGVEQARLPQQATRQGKAEGRTA